MLLEALGLNTTNVTMQGQSFVSAQTEIKTEYAGNIENSGDC